LLPFDTKQSATLTEYSNYLSNDVFTDDQYYLARRELLSDIRTTDQRSAWFNGTTDYSFDASDTTLASSLYRGTNPNSENNTRSSYLFFKNNMVNTDEYKSLDKYVGLYTYNGTVAKNTDGTYSLTPNKLSIDDMLDEFVGYINFLTKGSNTYKLNEDYYKYTTYYYENDEDKKDEIDYSKFVYATGKIDFNGVEASKNNMFVKESTSNISAAQYLVMSAVNELQYAYTTDTGILSYYVGYSVSAYTTSYIKEFEYAAQTAVKGGAGSYSVCAGDYGWHLIYVTDTFDVKGGATYSPEFTDARINTEGTFENQFYAWIKDSLLTNETTNKQTTILKLYSDDTTVTLYEDTYQDLLELDDD
jgi:hypothetical protein